MAFMSQHHSSGPKTRANGRSMQLRLARSGEISPLMKNAKLPCPDNGLRTPANAQLVINLLHVPFDRTLGQTQPVSYLPIAEAAADHRANVGLPPQIGRASGRERVCQYA